MGDDGGGGGLISKEKFEEMRNALDKDGDGSVDKVSHPCASMRRRNITIMQGDAVTSCRGLLPEYCPWHAAAPGHCDHMQ